jgi:hypothetical protein
MKELDSLICFTLEPTVMYKRGKSFLMVDTFVFRFAKLKRVKRATTAVTIKSGCEKSRIRFFG